MRERCLFMRILIADDDAEHVAVLSSLLQLLGHECECFTVPRLAVTANDKNPYDIVLTDLCMPDMNGKEVLQHVVSKKTKTIVIIITGLYDPQMAAELLAQGAYALFTKPLDVNQLIRSIELLGVKQDNLST
ncbi:response regulator [Sporomusa malonica]|uniref:response regulator n=2 Tax=Sporomusa malonica TaxID=112901 RepID=UPI0009FD3366|nr:response regulator [Sporomusa malonica]